MVQYILLIQNNAKVSPSSADWNGFFEAARASGLFKGGSAIGDRCFIGDTETALSSGHIGGYMRFDADDRQSVLDLLKLHPVVIAGGTVELCELPKS